MADSNTTKNQETSAKYMKNLLGLQDASVKQITDSLLNNGTIDSASVPKVTAYLSHVKGMAVSGVLAWDSSKTNGENISNVIGTIAQDTVVTAFSRYQVPLGNTYAEYTLPSKA